MEKIKKDEKTKKLIDDSGRALALLFNRAFMYNTDHPIVAEAAELSYRSLERVLNETSPVVFILSRDQFYIEEQPLDPKVNIWRMANHFKKAKIESVSFYKGMRRDQFRVFFNTLFSLNKYPDANAINKELFKKGISNIKINHIFYKKVSVDDEVISGDAVNEETKDDATRGKLKQMILESVFNSVLMEKFMGGLDMQNIIERPGQITDFMISSDLSTAKKHDKDGQRPGHFLIHQIEALDQEIGKNIAENKDVSLSDLAKAMMDIRQKLIEGIEAQKAKGIVYTNEKQIINKANEITDNVLIELIKEEYKSGDIPIPRIAQIICRIIPDVDELKRLLPKIKIALLEAGMPLSDFMALVQELESELKSDSLAAILTESAEKIGLDGEELIEKIIENPLKSAEMIYLVSEIKKGGGDENKLTEILVDYIEQVGSHVSSSVSVNEVDEGKIKIEKVMTDTKSSLVQQLNDMNVRKDVLNRLQEKLNERMDAALDKMKEELIKTHSEITSSLTYSYNKELSVLETLERSTSSDDNIDEFIQIVRRKVESGDIDENDFNQIYKEISKHDQARKSIQEQKLLPAGILMGEQLIICIDKEIARANRHDSPLTVLGFSLVHAKEEANLKGGQIKKRDIIDAIMLKLAKIFRNIDILGEFKTNHIIALLPMAKKEDGYIALYRATKLLHLQPLRIYGIPVTIRVAGISIPPDFKPLNASDLIKQVTLQLSDMSTRLRNIHGY